jgi:hypothetical protein
VLARFGSRTWPETETFSSRTAREPRERASFLYWKQTEKEEKDGEATFSGAVPALAFHRGEGIRANPVV